MSETWERAQQARLAGDLDAAAQLYLETLQSHPFGSRQALGIISANLGRVDEAETWFREAIAAGPARPAARYSFAIFLLRLGRYAEAWPFYEARREIAGFAIPSFGDLLPEWRGEDPAGKRLVVVGEQGFGDQIMFARFLAPLRAAGADVRFHCGPALVRLFPGARPGVDLKVRPGADFWTVVGSLPLHLGTTLENLPPPVAFAPLSQSQATAAAAGPRVGVLARGSPANSNDANRSLPPDAMAELLALGRDLAPEATGAGDFLDTAEIVAGLDLVITVDTALAHLAGSMGKPAWVLLPHHDSDWRWMRGRGDSLWYPSLRLYRQPTRGDWAAPLAEVQRDLAAWAPLKAAGK